MIEFTLNKYRLWLKGYVLYDEESEDGEKILKVTDHDARNVILDCPSLLGLKPIWDYPKTKLS
jgi:hypothetical protein